LVAHSKPLAGPAPLPAVELPADGARHLVAVEAGRDHLGGHVDDLRVVDAGEQVVDRAHGVATLGGVRHHRDGELDEAVLTEQPVEDLRAVAHLVRHADADGLDLGADQRLEVVHRRLHLAVRLLADGEARDDAEQGLDLRATRL
jgi:hypothetical protein